MKIVGVEYENSSPSALDNGCVAIDVTTNGEDRVRFVPLFRAKWIWDKENNYHIEKIFLCSRCNWNAWGTHERTPYCPGCGAQMEIDMEGFE